MILLDFQRRVMVYRGILILKLHNILVSCRVSQEAAKIRPVHIFHPDTGSASGNYALQLVPMWGVLKCLPFWTNNRFRDILLLKLWRIFVIFLFDILSSVSFILFINISVINRETRFQIWRKPCNNQIGLWLLYRLIRLKLRRVELRRRWSRLPQIRVLAVRILMARLLEWILNLHLQHQLLELCPDLLPLLPLFLVQSLEVQHLDLVQLFLLQLQLKLVDLILHLDFFPILKLHGSLAFTELLLRVSSFLFLVP